MQVQMSKIKEYYATKDDMLSISQNTKEPWLLVATKKKGGVMVSMRMCTTFRGRINECNLLDLGFVKPKYTWRWHVYHGGQRIYEKLNRAISNEIWRLKLRDAYVKNLTRVDFSDHHPILITPVDGLHQLEPKQIKLESA